MRWFYYLNNGEENLFNQHKVKKGSFPVCNEGNGKKEYGVFQSAYSLYEYCVDLDDQHRCLFEIIKSNVCQKIYFDIDIPLDESNHKIYHSEIEKINISKQIPELMVDSIIKTNPIISRNDIMIFSSHSNTKKSFHIIVDRWYVENARKNRKFFDSVLKFIPETWKQYFDNSMYKSIQQFRMYMSTKYGKERMKIIDPSSPWKIDNDIETEYANETIFYASLITKTNYCNILTFDDDEDEDETEHISSYMTYMLDDTEMSKVLKIISSMDYFKCFRVDIKDKNSILLKRLLPSFCSVCNRIHHNQNSFVFVTINGNIMLNCMRNDENKHTCLGNINDTHVENSKKYEFVKEKPFFEEKKNSIPETVSSQSLTSLTSMNSTQSLTSITSMNVPSPLSVTSPYSSLSPCLKQNYPSESTKENKFDKRRRQNKFKQKTLNEIFNEIEYSL